MVGAFEQTVSSVYVTPYTRYGLIVSTRRAETSFNWQSVLKRQPPLRYLSFG